MFDKMFSDTHHSQNYTEWYLDEVPNAILDRIIIKCEIQKTKGDLILQESLNKPSWGTIVSIGPGRCNEKAKFIPTTLKIGQRVFWFHRVGTYFEINRELYVMMKQEFIDAVEN